MRVKSRKSIPGDYHLASSGLVVYATVSKIVVANLIRKAKETAVGYFVVLDLYFKVNKRFYRLFKILQERNAAYVNEVGQINGR